MIHASQVGAVGQVELALADAKKADKFMVAIWRVEESGELVCRRTTWQFPTARLMEAVQQLDNMIGEELHPARTPLPLAKFLAQRPVEMDESVADQAEPQIDLNTARAFVGVPRSSFNRNPLPPIINAVMPLDSEDAE